MGSSSSSTSLPANRMRASSTRRRSPPDSTVEREVEPVGGEPEAGGDAAHLGLGRVAAVVAERLLGPGEAADVALRGVLLDARAAASRAGGPPRRGPGPTARGRAPVASTPDAARAGVLGQVAEAALAQRRCRRRPGASPPSTLQQAGLAGAVAADQPDLVAGADGERRLDEREAPADLDAELADLEHPTSLSPPAGRTATQLSNTLLRAN